MQMQLGFRASCFVLPQTATGYYGRRRNAQNRRELLQAGGCVAVALDRQHEAFRKVLCRRSVRLGEDADRRAEDMWLGMLGRLLNAFADSVNKIRRTNFDRLDEQRRRVFVRVIERALSA
jgi:hypothetical protein